MFYGWYVVAGTFVSQLAVVGFSPIRSACSPR